MTTATEQVRGAVRETGWWGLVLLLATEAALFAYLLFSYFYVASRASGVWPPGGLPDLQLALPNTAILLASSATMWWAESAVRAGRRGRSVLGLAATLALGVVFLTIQGIEYSHARFTPQTDAYGSLFFLVTGFHGAHVLVGIIMIALALVWTATGRAHRGRHLAVTNTAWYWHFVDVVWLVVFTSLYLSPRFR